MFRFNGYSPRAFPKNNEQIRGCSFQQAFNALMARVFIGGVMVIGMVNNAISATTIETVSTVNDGQNIAVFLGDDDLPRVLTITRKSGFDRPTTIEVATCLDPVCNFPLIERIDAGLEGFPIISQLGFDSRGFPYFIYHDRFDFDQSTRLLRCNDEICSTFSEEDVISSTYTLRADDRLMETRVNQGSDRLRLTQCADLSCTSRNSGSTIDEVVDGRLQAFNTDANGFPVFVYESGEEPGALLARCNDVTCSSPLIQSIDLELVSFRSRGYSVVVDNSDRPVISLADSDGLSLIICSDSQCTTSTRRAVDSAQLSSDLQVDMNGNAVLAYRRSGTVRLARCQDQGCENLSVEVVDEATGRPPSLVLDSVGNPVIAYGNNTLGISKLARCDNLNCSSSGDDLPNVGRYLLRSVETGRFLDADRNGSLGTSAVPRLDDEWDLDFATPGLSTPFTLTNSQFATPIDNTDWVPEPAGDGTFFLRRISNSSRNYLSTTGRDVFITFQNQSDRWEFIPVQN